MNEKTFVFKAKMSIEDLEGNLIESRPILKPVHSREGYACPEPDCGYAFFAEGGDFQVPPTCHRHDDEPEMVRTQLLLCPWCADEYPASSFLAHVEHCSQEGY